MDVKAVEVAKKKRESALKEIRKEKRILISALFFAATATLVWIPTVATDYWYVFSNSSFSINAGLWKSCVIHNNSLEESCTYYEIFPSREELKSLDSHVIDYRRACMLFSLLSLMLMMMALTSAFYTFKNSRYMYKTLAATLFLLAGFCVLVVLEVIVTYVNYEDARLRFHYGPCFGIGWVVFLVYIITSSLFMIYSKKKVPY